MEDEINVNPAMVTLARESRGITQTEAAKNLGISQGHLSKIEMGYLLPVPEGLLDRMAEEFHYPQTFFALDAPIVGADFSEMFHRKRQAIGARKLRQIHAAINVMIINITPLLKSVEINDAIPIYDPDENTPEEIARMVRAYWRLPAGPIESMVGAIENAGGIVIPYSFGTRHIDALSRRPLGGLPRFFFIDKNIPGDRQRFTLAHELGHVIMHGLAHNDMEKEANQFASEFLMPESEIKTQFTRVDVHKLASLKPYWKVSMAALLYRASSLGRISPRMNRELNMQLSKAGYKTNEPIYIPPEEPTLLNEIIEIHRNELGYDPHELSDLMKLYEDEAQQKYAITKPDGKQGLRRVK